MTTEIVLNSKQDVCDHGWVHTDRATTSTNFSQLAQYTERRSISLSLTLESPHDHFFKGREEMDARRFDEAAEEFFSAIQLQWNFIEAHIELGNAYSELRQYGKALSAYADALEIDPSSTLALYNTALTHADLKDRGRALEWLEKTIEADRAYKLAYLLAAALLCQEERQRDAIRKLLIFARLQKPEDADAWVRAGIIYEELGESAHSANCYQRAIRADAWHPQAYYRLGLSQMEAGNIHAANLSFANALKSRPQFPEAEELFKKTKRSLSSKKRKRKGSAAQESLFQEPAAA